LQDTIFVKTVGKETMKVKELIRKLQECNPDAEVRVVEEVDNGDPNYWVTLVDEREDEVLIIGKE